MEKPERDEKEKRIKIKTYIYNLNYASLILRIENPVQRSKPAKKLKRDEFYSFCYVMVLKHRK